jgi:HK97 family phage prohead protease
MDNNQLIKRLLKLTRTDEQIAADIAKRHGLDAEKVKLMRFAGDFEMGEDRKFNCTINTDSLDSYDSVVLPQGCDPTAFLKIPTLYWNHDYEEPIGRALTLEKTNNTWRSQGQLALRPEDFVGPFFPDYVAAMVGQRIVRGVSVGFLPIEVRQPTKQDIEKWGRQLQIVYSKWKLLEYSITPTPANTDALIDAIRKLDEPLVYHGPESDEGFANLLEIKKESVAAPVKKKVQIVVPWTEPKIKAPAQMKLADELATTVRVEIARKRGRLYE